MADVQPASGALLPTALVVKKGLKISSRISFGMPGPVSLHKKNHLPCIHIKMSGKKDRPLYVHHRLNRILNDLQGHLA